MTNDEARQLLLQAIGAGASGIDQDETRTQQLSESLSELARRIAELRQAGERQLEGVEENTRATLENTAVRIQQAGGSVVSKAGSVLSGIGSSLTLSPILGGLIKLFGGREPEPPEKLPTYLPPPVIRAEGAPGLSGRPTVEAIRYGTDGLPIRVFQDAPPPAPAVPITIQVQAIDSRSFLDHSESIARAVREAMLNTHSLNDVITDL